MVLALFAVITAVVMVAIYGAIQPRGLVLSVFRRTVNTVELGINYTGTTRPPPPSTSPIGWVVRKRRVIFSLFSYNFYTVFV